MHACSHTESIWPHMERKTSSLLPSQEKDKVYPQRWRPEDYPNHQMEKIRPDPQMQRPALWNWPEKGFAGLSYTVTGIIRIRAPPLFICTSELKITSDPGNRCSVCWKSGQDCTNRLFVVIVILLSNYVIFNLQNERSIKVPFTSIKLNKIIKV